MYCSKCGKKLGDQARFCSACGHPVSQDVQQESNAEAQETSSETEATTVDVESIDVSASKDSAESSASEQVDELAHTASAQTSFKAALDSSKKKSKRRIPIVVLVALVTLLVSSVAYAAYYVYTEVVVPQIERAQQAQDSSDTNNSENAGTSAENAENDQASMRAQLYLDKIQELTQTYGEGHIVQDPNSQDGDYLAGLCAILLIDFDADGTEELLVAYRNPNNEIRYFDDAFQHNSLPSYYTIEVWGTENNSLNQLWAGAPWGHEAMMASFDITQHGGNTYLCATCDGIFYRTYYTLTDENTFACVKTFDHGVVNITSDWTIDGSPVSREDYAAQSEEWDANAVSTRLNWLSDTADGMTILNDSQTAIAQLKNATQSAD